MIKKIGLIMVLILALFAVACTIAGHQIKIDDPATKDLVAWGAGQTLGFAINTLTPKSDQALGIAWDEFMNDHKNDEFVQPKDVIMLHDFCVSIIALDYGDAWGIVSDLRFLLSNYGVRMSVDGKKIIEIEPVPMLCFIAFQAGYESGKQKAAMVMRG